MILPIAELKSSILSLKGITSKTSFSDPAIFKAIHDFSHKFKIQRDNDWTEAEIKEGSILINQVNSCLPEKEHKQMETFFNLMHHPLTEEEDKQLSVIFDKMSSTLNSEEMRQLCDFFMLTPEQKNLIQYSTRENQSLSPRLFAIPINKPSLKTNEEFMPRPTYKGSQE